MNTVKFNSQKPSRNIDWKLFFNMKIFRYAFFNQLKSISTYIFFCLTMVVSGLLLWMSFSLSKYIIDDFNDYDYDNISKITEIPVNFYKIYLYILFMIIFTLFITFKSLQIFRNEMDDGTLLIFSSMPFSRLKLIFQKWLSLQAVCLLFTLVVIFISPFIFLIIQGFSMPSWEVTKDLYKKSSNLIIASIIFQILISTFAVLISLYLGKTGTIGFLSLFSALSIVIFFVPMIIESSVLNHGSSSLMNLKLKSLGQKSEQSNLFRYYNDPDLKELFEIENWYTTDQKIDDISYLLSENNHEQFQLTFEPSLIAKVHDILNPSVDSNVEQKKQALFTKKISVVDITASKTATKAVKEIFTLFNKVKPKVMNLCPIRMSKIDYWEYKIAKEDRKLFKSQDVYKNALDDINNFSQKEKKIVQLSKLLLESFDSQNMKNIEVVQVKQDTRIFIDSLIKQYTEIYGSTAYLTSEQKIRDLLGDNEWANQSFYFFIDNLAFRNLSFLIKNLSQQIISNMFQMSNGHNNIMKDKESLEKYLKFIKANNYLNIMTQIAFIWNDNNSKIIFQSPLLHNYYGEWEKKESTYLKQDGTSAKLEYLKLKPDSFKKIISPTLLYILYPLISFSLVGLLIYMVYKRDFV